MKKIVFSLLILSFFAAKIHAQSDDWDERPFRFGIQVSPTWAWMGTTDKNIEGAGTNWGGKLQVMAEKKINSNDRSSPSNYYLTTGLGFSFNQGGFLQNNYQQGTFWTKSDLSRPGLDTVGLESKLHYRLTYIEIPFGLKMIGGTGTDSKMRFYAEAPIITLGFMNSNAKGDILSNGNENSDDEIIRDDVNGLALSWGLGAGIEYELSPTTRLVTGLNFQKQFTDVTDNKASVRVNDTDWRQDDSKANISMITWRIGIFF